MTLAEMLSTEPISMARRGAIREALAAVCDNAFGSGLRALVLTGSVARGEETIISTPAGERLLGDVEAMVVLQNTMPLPAAKTVAELCRRIERCLADAGLQTQVSLGVVHGGYLRRLPRHIFSYELKVCGEVIWGDENILALIPFFAATEISREDAWRMLGNRVIEYLRAAFAAGDGPQLLARGEHVSSSGNAGLSDGLHYATVKLCLDLATSLLVFLGRYEPTYGAREEQFKRMARETGGRLPFPAAEFLHYLRRCTRWKLQPEAEQRERDPGFCFAVLEYARRAWLWELEQLAGAGDDAELMVRRLAQCQGAAARLRGWAYVLRRRGWWRSAADWPRWLRLARRYSPRYAIYLAAFQLLQAAGFAGGVTKLTLAGACALLPGGASEPASLEQAVAQLAANYDEFLVGTRA
jgi:hypothetical protein